MPTFTLTLQQNIFDVYHLVHFLMSVWQLKHICCKCISYENRTESHCMLPNYCSYREMPKWSWYNCDNSYNCLTFNRWISPYTVMQCTKTKVIHYNQYYRSNSQTALAKPKQCGYATLGKIDFQHPVVQQRVVFSLNPACSAGSHRHLWRGRFRCRTLSHFTQSFWNDSIRWYV